MQGLTVSQVHWFTSYFSSAKINVFVIRSNKVKYRFTTVTVLQLDLKFSGPVRVRIIGVLLHMFFLRYLEKGEELFVDIFIRDRS